MKKVVSLLLVLVLALGMSSVAFAATGVGVTTPIYIGSIILGSGINTDINQDLILQITGNKVWVPIEEIKDVGTSGITHPTTTELKKAKVTVKGAVKAGSKAFEGLSIVKFDDTAGGNFSAVEFEFVDPFVSVKDIDVEIIATFYINGKRTDDTIHLFTNYSNDTIEISADEDYVDIYDGYILHGLEYSKLCEVEIGENVSVWTKVFKDKDYYGRASRDDDEKDDVVYAKYPDVDSIITIQSIGLSSTAQYVTFNDFDDTFWVYGVDMKYLGKSDEKLAFSSKYYLANKELSIDGDDEEPDDGDVPDAPEPDAGTGGDDSLANVNDNPGTGA